MLGVKVPMAKWLILGGRQAGLHQRRPLEAFALQYTNAMRAWIADPSVLPTLIFVQVDLLPYFLGVYGFNVSKGDVITHVCK